MIKRIASGKGGAGLEGSRWFVAALIEESRKLNANSTKKGPTPLSTKKEEANACSGGLQSIGVKKIKVEKRVAPRPVR